MSYTYGEPEIDKTPLDLFMAGYVIRRHVNGVAWCYSQANPYGTGIIYGAPRATLEEVYADARWRMGVDLPA